MALTTDKRVWKSLILIFIALTIIFSILFYFKIIFISFVVGISMIVIYEKLIQDYKKRLDKYKLSGIKRKFVGYIILTFWILIILFFLSSSLNQLASAVSNLDRGNQTISGIYIDKLQKYIQLDSIQGVFTDNIIQKMETYILSKFTSFFSQLSSFLGTALLIIPLLFYLYYKRRHQILKKIYTLIPKEFHISVSRAAKAMSGDINDFITAKVIQSTVVGGICCFGFFIAGVKGWLFLGILAGFLNIVPYLGPIIGAIPPLLITLLVDQPVIALYVLITVVIAQLVDNFYLVPFMISSKVKIDSFLSIILVLTGAQLLGIMGMVFAVPIYLVYKIVLKESYNELLRVCSIE